MKKLTSLDLIKMTAAPTDKSPPPAAAPAPSAPPVNHGRLAVSAPAPSAPLIPRALRGKSFTSRAGKSAKQLEEEYGVWRCRALADMRVAGHAVAKGDTFLETGDQAVTVVLMGLAEFDDEKLEEENRVIEAAKKLGLPQTIREIAGKAERTSTPGHDYGPLRPPGMRP